MEARPFFLRSTRDEAVGAQARAARLTGYWLITRPDELRVFGLQPKARSPALIRAAKAFGDEALQTHPACGVKNDIALGGDRLAKENSLGVGGQIRQ